MSAGPTPMCYVCKHFHGPGKRTCDAFRDGIPGSLFWGSNSHTKHYPGDLGIQFEEIEDHYEVRPAEVGPIAAKADSP